MNLVLILMLANCGDLIVKSLMKLLKETLENHLAWNKSLIIKVKSQSLSKSYGDMV